MWKTSSAAYLMPPAPGEPDAWTSETKGRGRQTVKVLRHPPRSIATEVWTILMTRNVVTRQRLLTVDGRPVEVATSFYPASIAAGTALAEPAPIKGGAVRLLADMGYTATRAVEDVQAVGADDDLTELLGVTQGFPLLVMRRTSEVGSGERFEYLHTAACDGRRQQYVMELA